MHAFCAGDLVGAWGGHRLLREQGISVDIFSGPVTDNAVGVRYLEETLGTRAINAYRNPDGVRSIVINAIGFFILFFLVALGLAYWVDGELALNFMIWQGLWIGLGTLWLLGGKWSPLACPYQT